MNPTVIILYFLIIIIHIYLIFFKKSNVQES